MPVGGRINRRDNLRSKKALIKSNVPDKIKKQSNVETNIEVNNLLESKNKHENVKGSDSKSEVIAKGFQSIYVRLEDLKLFERKELLKNENNNNLGEMCLSVKGGAKLVSPIKGSNKSPKNEEPKLPTNEVVVENLYDNLKIKGRHNNKIKEFELKTPVVVEDTDTLKRRGRKKKEIVEIEESNVETVVETQIEATPKKRGRIPKKKDDLEVVKTSEQEVIKEVEINNKTDENNTTSKLTRRNAFQKVRDEKIVVDKMDIEDEILESQDNKPRVRASRIAKLVDLKEDLVDKEKDNTVTESVARTGSRLSKNKKAFVVETTNENEMNEMKIPGLVMLNNIRNRKSEMKLAKENLSSKSRDEKSKGGEEKSDESVNKSSPIDISQVVKENLPVEEKSAAVAIKKKGKTLQKVVKEANEISEENEKSNEKIPGLRMTADIKRRKSEMLGVLAKEITVEIEKKPTNVRQSIRSNNKIPGLASVEVESSNRLRNNNAVSDNHEKETEEVVETKESVRKTGLLARSVVNSLASNQKPKEKITHKGKPPMTSDKIPGLSATSQLKKQKLESNLAGKSATLDRNYKTNERSEFNGKDSEKKSTKEKIDLSGTLPSKAATLDSTASIKFLNFKDHQKPVFSGILAKPSPFKRPISCLDPSAGDDIDLFDTKCKQSRMQPDNRRQSVTFNREVEVKEIHGDSFNSVTGDEAELGEAGGAGEEEGMMDRLREELERTKNRVLEKRTIQQHNTSYSNDFFKEKQRKNAFGPSMFAGNDLSASFPKKSSSDLSNLISTRIKIQSNSPPRENTNNQEIISRARPQYHHNLPANNNNVDQSKSGALKKIAPFSSSSSSSYSTQKETLSNWRSFQQNPSVQSNKKPIGNEINETINDDSMEIDKKPEESNKSSCLIM